MYEFPPGLLGSQISFVLFLFLVILVFQHGFHGQLKTKAEKEREITVQFLYICIAYRCLRSSGPWNHIRHGEIQAVGGALGA